MSGISIHLGENIANTTESQCNSMTCANCSPGMRDHSTHPQGLNSDCKRRIQPSAVLVKAHPRFMVKEMQGFKPIFEQCVLFVRTLLGLLKSPPQGKPLMPSCCQVFCSLPSYCTPDCTAGRRKVSLLKALHAAWGTPLGWGQKGSLPRASKN